MKYSHKRVRIREALEQRSRKKNNSPESGRRRQHQGLGLNWKDAVIFSLALFYLSLYQINAHAQTAIDFNDIDSGMLLRFDPSNGEYAFIEMTGVEYRVDIAGMIASVTVRQRFINNTGEWINQGVYAHPLADRSAVYALEMTVGERVIVGEIHEKVEAERIYRTAVASGQTATLVKQYRPNLFTTDVANIPPGEEVTVEIAYQQSLRYDAGHLELRIPMSIKARYLPPGSEADVPGSTIQAARERRIEVNLDAGFALESLRSLYHEVDIESKGALHRVALLDDTLLDAHDFVLRWSPLRGALPQAALFTEYHDNAEYALLMVLPPEEKQQQITQARNITYIIDTSGSMQGMALNQAKDALLYALSELDAETHFNVIEFNSNARALFRASQPATPEKVALALDFVTALVSTGGTQMAPALNLAMQQENRVSGRLNQIIFITDGSVGNEADIFNQIATDIGDARLFTVAIGQAPNNYFMRKAAMFGRGTYTHIGELREVDQSMRTLFDKIATPTLTDVAVDWPIEVEQSPSTLSDLYADEPIVITARMPVFIKDFEISGLVGNKSWQQSLQLSQRDVPGVARLWARNQVEEWTDEMMLGGDRGVLRDAIIDLALQHRLVTEFTALVAVDKTPRQDNPRDLTDAAYPQTALGWRAGLLWGTLCLLLGGLLRRRTATPS